MLQDVPILSLFISVVAAYLCGSIPTGILIGQRLGIAVREIGSGNIGATNVARSVGTTAGLLTLLGDMAKGLTPVLVVRFLDLGEIVLVCTAIAAILGHIFSVFLSFSGGKGVATGFGVFLGLAPQAILCAFLGFLVLFGLTRIVSLASLAAAIVTPLFLILFAYPTAHVIAGLTIALLIIARHRENIARLWKGEEPRLQLGKPSPPPA